MLCYGAHTNLSLLEHYGFLLPPETTNGSDARAARAGTPRSVVTELKIMSPRLGRTTTTRRRAMTRRRHRLATDAFGRLSWTALADLRVDAACADADVRRLEAREARAGRLPSPADAVSPSRGASSKAVRATPRAGPSGPRDHRRAGRGGHRRRLGARASERATAIPASSTRRETRDARAWTSTARRESGREWTTTTTTTTTTTRISRRHTRQTLARGAVASGVQARRAGGVPTRARRGWTRRSRRCAPRGGGDVITPSSDARAAKRRLRAAR